MDQGGEKGRCASEKTERTTRTFPWLHSSVHVVDNRTVQQSKMSFICGCNANIHHRKQKHGVAFAVYIFSGLKSPFDSTEPVINQTVVGFFFCSLKHVYTKVNTQVSQSWLHLREL